MNFRLEIYNERKCVPRFRYQPIIEYIFIYIVTKINKFFAVQRGRQTLTTAITDIFLKVSGFVKCLGKTK